MSAPLLEASGVRVRYGRNGSETSHRAAIAPHARKPGGNAEQRPIDHAVLDGIDLSVSQAQIVSVLGPSGCGKSTLLRVLAGIQHAAAGTVSIDGRPYDEPQPDIAIAFQDPCLLPWLDVSRNIGFGLDFKHQPSLDAARKRARIDTVLGEVGLLHARHARPSQLSGGMAQRVALARCLAREPRVLLLDEPFGALDEATREDMQDLLLRIVRHTRAATVLVTHDIDEALRVSDHIVLLGTNGRSAARWTLDASTPRDPIEPGYIALRDAIWRALRDARAGTEATGTTAATAIETH